MNILYNAISFFHNSKNLPPMKHRGINNKENFEKWAKEKGVLYINYYFKHNRQFDQKKWIN